MRFATRILCTSNDFVCFIRPKKRLFYLFPFESLKNVMRFKYIGWLSKSHWNFVYFSLFIKCFSFMVRMKRKYLVCQIVYSEIEINTRPKITIVGLFWFPNWTRLLFIKCFSKSCDITWGKPQIGFNPPQNVALKSDQTTLNKMPTRCSEEETIQSEFGFKDWHINYRDSLCVNPATYWTK